MKLLILLILAVAVTSFNVNKIHPALINRLKTKSNANVLIYMKEYMDFDNHMHNGKLLSTYTADERAEIIIKTLETIQQRSQKSIQEILKAKYHTEFESYWISNSIVIKNCPKSSILGLAMRSDVKEIFLDNPSVDPMEETTTVSEKHNEETRKQVEHNIAFVKAPEVWAQGFTGKGIVVGVADTGLIHTHPAIKNSYRGFQGGNRYNHDYNWKGRTNTPTDSNGHGTHCSGTVAGGFDRKIGVAPGAKVLHCAALGGVGVTACNQWFLAPTRVNGSGRQTSMRPHIISNSYRSGATYDREYTALINAGVAVVNSAGNGGNRCGTVNTNVRTRNQIAVANQVRGGTAVARSSARGPSPVSGLVRPFIAAPGSQVVSADNRSNGYTSKTGTSMSCPNVAGGLALIWEAVPSLRRNIAATNRILERSSTALPTDECNRSGDPRHPNHVTGWGTANYERAIRLAKVQFESLPDN